MVFWILCAVMTLAATAAILVPMLRGGGTPLAAPDAAIYKAQLAEIDRDVARDVLAADEAERARVEISRRLLSVSKTTVTAMTAPAGISRMTAGISAVSVIVIAAFGYFWIGAPGATDAPLAQRLAMADDQRVNRPNQAALEASAPPAPQMNPTPEHLEMIEQLRAIMVQRPDDIRGWALVAEHEAMLANFSAAATAQARVIELLDGQETLEDLTFQVDLMVQAAGGVLSPEAEAIVARILDRDPDNAAALYHLGALYAQTGRADLAFRVWRPVMDQNETSFHAALIRSRIDAVAQMAGVRYSAPDVSGPSADDIAAAKDLSADDRAAMIAGMVQQLSDRLATEGGGPSEWARLISAYGVLGDTENAAVIWTEARDVFGADEAAMDILTEAARSAGVLE